MLYTFAFGLFKLVLNHKLTVLKTHVTTYCWHYSPINVLCTWYLKYNRWVIMFCFVRNHFEEPKPMPEEKRCGIILPPPPPYCKYGPIQTGFSLLFTCDLRWCNACLSNHQSVQCVGFLTVWCWSKCGWNPSLRERQECCHMLGCVQVMWCGCTVMCQTKWSL